MGEDAKEIDRRKVKELYSVDEENTNASWGFGSHFLRLTAVGQVDPVVLGDLGIWRDLRRYIAFQPSHLGVMEARIAKGVAMAVRQHFLNKGLYVPVAESLDVSILCFAKSAGMMI